MSHVGSMCLAGMLLVTGAAIRGDRGTMWRFACLGAVGAWIVSLLGR